VLVTVSAQGQPIYSEGDGSAHPVKFTKCGPLRMRVPNVTRKPHSATQTAVARPPMIKR
jgi:hypothetical protein